MQKTIWITGASSGIGREFARRYAAMGCRLILTARRADRLQALCQELHAAHGTECRIETADLLRAEGVQPPVRGTGRGAHRHLHQQRRFRRLRQHSGNGGSPRGRDDQSVNVAAMARLFRAVVRGDAQGGGTILIMWRPPPGCCRAGPIWRATTPAKPM